MLFKKLKSKSGVTMVELVIVLAIMGILAVTVIPMYSKLQSKSQYTRNESNMTIIQEAFINYFYYTYSIGTPHYPPPPHRRCASGASPGRRRNRLLFDRGRGPAATRR